MQPGSLLSVVVVSLALAGCGSRTTDLDTPQAPVEPTFNRSTPLVTFADAALTFAQDDAFVYAASTTGISRVDKTSLDVERVLDLPGGGADMPQALVADATHLYWLSTTTVDEDQFMGMNVADIPAARAAQMANDTRDGLWSAPKDASGPPVQLARPEAGLELTSLVLHGDRLYLLESPIDLQRPPTRVLGVATTGGPVEVVATRPDSFLDIDSFTIDDEALYFCRHGTVSRVSRDASASPSETTISTDDNGCTDLRLDDDVLMWAVPPSLTSETLDDGTDAIGAAPDAKLRKAPKTGGSVTTLAIGNLAGYGVDHGTAFFARWVDARGVETISTPAIGPEPRDLLSVTQSVWLGQILVDAKRVYVAERKSEDPGYALRVIDR